MGFNSSGDWTLASVIVMGCWLGIVIFIGIFGNILVIIVSVQGTRVRRRGKSLIVSMAVADMLESINMIFMLITIAFYGEWIFGDTMCQLHGFVAMFFLCTSTCSLAVISINRYFIVVRSNQYQQVFTKAKTILIIISIWVFSFLEALPPLVGWSKFEFQSNKAACMFYFSTSKSYSIFLIMINVPGLMMVMMFCSYKIYGEVRHHQAQVHAHAADRHINVEEIRITKTLIIIIMACVVCFIPPAISNFIEAAQPKSKIPFWLDIVPTVLLFTNHANNPIIYGLFNRHYRHAFKELFTGLTPSNN